MSTMTMNNLTICDRIESFLDNQKGCVATLKEIYRVIKDHAEETVRAAIYRDRSERFKRVASGVYMLKGEKTASLIIQGDGRSLVGIDDNSIDVIITDHPWSDSKSHKSGNQKNFADYDCFRYTQEDFNQKARVLRDGCFDAEFLPVENANNYEYLFEIKQMAKNAELNYYASIRWHKNPEGTINTGRTTKGIEDIVIFYKGKKPRRLNEIIDGKNPKAYFTKNILCSRLEIPALTPSQKHHQAEKPIDVYRYLIENLSDEDDVTLDQFSGACNLAKASIDTGRWGICYEYAKEFVKKAVKRFSAIKLYSEDSTDSVDVDESYYAVPSGTMEVIEVSKDVMNIVETDNQAKTMQVVHAENGKEIESNMVKTKNQIPTDKTASFQFNKLTAIMKAYPNLLDEKAKEFLANYELNDNNKAILNSMFQFYLEEMYATNYSTVNIELSMMEEKHFNKLKKDVKNVFDSKTKNPFIRVFYNNYLIETLAFIRFLTKDDIYTLLEIREKLDKHLENYEEFLDKECPNKKSQIISIVKKMLD